MPSVHCDLIGFDSSRPSTATVTIDPLILMLTAATVGMPTIASHPASRRPLLEMQWRIAMVAANLRITDDGTRWTRSDAYNRLDPSEKTSVSYFLGMTQAALMSRLVLQYPHLVHVDLLLAQQGTKLAGKRPDFVAVDPLNRVRYSATVEAKGRTNGFDQGALDKAKQQASILPGIARHHPTERVGSEAYFNEYDHWASVLEDPDGDAQPLQFGVETYLLVYYRTIIEAGREAPTWEADANEYRFQVPGYDLTIGLPVRIVDAYDRSAALANNAERDAEAHLLTAYTELHEQYQDSDSAPTGPADELNPTTDTADVERSPAVSFVTATTSTEDTDGDSLRKLFIRADDAAGPTTP